MKRALVTGITGQDGQYLLDLLLEKEYYVHGIVRWTSFTSPILKQLQAREKLYLHTADMADSASLQRVIDTCSPDEIYNLAALSHVKESFSTPESAANINALGPLRLLEAIRALGAEKCTRFYQASTSELFGKAFEIPQNEETPFYPRSPYGVAKLYAYWATVNYRESYGMYACNGILYNHESPLRGETFVTRKITLGLSRVLQGKQAVLQLGNLDAKRDWGHAKDYVKAQWLILQQDKPRDYVIATGSQHSVRDFIELALETLGVSIDWVGRGASEKGVIASIENPEIEEAHVGQTIIQINPQYFRPAEVDSLMGDSSRAYKELGWKPEVGFAELVKEMVLSDWDRVCEDVKVSLCF